MGSVNNMHREYRYDVTDALLLGENCLRVELHSPVRYIKEENKKVFAGGVSDGMEGYPHLRKAHCMFGWDWGPRLPDMGIFRGVELVGTDTAALEQVYVTQEHDGSGAVRLSVKTACKVTKGQRSADRSTSALRQRRFPRTAKPMGWSRTEAS